MRRIEVTALAALITLSSACDRPVFYVGEDCILNTDCVQPLVCRLDRCRLQCVDSRDCGAGLLCLQIGEEGGVCQLPEEATCALASECTTGLDCRFGTCTTACVEDRDCGPGATCAADDGATACHEPEVELCIYDSDCPFPNVCGPDQLCRLECLDDRDCMSPRCCNLANNLCVLPDTGDCAP